MNKLIASLGLAFGAFISAAPASAAIVVDILPAQQHVNVGDTASVDVRISGLGAEILSAYDLNLLFNDSVLGGGMSIVVQFCPFESAACLGGLEAPIFSGSFDPGNNGVMLNSMVDDATLAADQADSFVFLKFNWTGMTDGFSMLNFGGDPDFERNFTGLDAQSLEVQINGACIAVGNGVCDIPEPASFGLVGLALAGLLVPAARRRSAAA